MANIIIMLLVIAALSDVGHGRVGYVYHGKNNEHWIEEGTSVTIACHFNGNKPKGPSRWTVNGEVVTIDCNVKREGKGIITPTVDCFPDNGDGTANYSFVINEVSLDRDKDTWICQNFDLDEKLSIPIKVEGGTAGYSVNCQGQKKLPFSVTANVGCTYPSGKVRWCMHDGSETNCSERTDWAANVFETDPVISQTTEECTEYTTPGVLKYTSTIEGKLAGGVNIDKYKMYYSLNGIDFNKNVIRLQDIRRAEYIEEVSDICMNKFCTVANVLYKTAIGYLAALTILTLRYGLFIKIYQKGPNKYLDGAFYVVTSIGCVLSLTSFIIFICIHSMFQELFVDDFLVGVIGILAVPYTMVLCYYIKQRMSQKMNAKGEKQEISDREEVSDKKNLENGDDDELLSARLNNPGDSGISVGLRLQDVSSGNSGNRFIPKPDLTSKEVDDFQSDAWDIC